MKNAYRIGDTITWIDAGGIKIGVVVRRHVDVRNGWPGFSAKSLDGKPTWGYDEDVTRVLLLASAPVGPSLTGRH